MFTSTSRSSLLARYCGIRVCLTVENLFRPRALWARFSSACALPHHVDQKLINVYRSKVRDPVADGQSPECVLPSELRLLRLDYDVQSR